MLRQLVRFASVGGVGFVIDVCLFTLLRVTVLAPEHITQGPLIAKAMSTCVAIVVNWVGNRYWTFGPHRSARGAREAGEFVAVSLLGMLVGLGCLWFSRDVLRFRSVFSDNLSSNGVGLLLGSALRFWLYRTWVYRPGRHERRTAAAPLDDRIMTTVGPRELAVTRARGDIA